MKIFILSDATTDNHMQTAAAIWKKKNEESCPIYKLSTDLLKLIVGENQYRFLACTLNFRWIHSSLS